MVGEGHDCVSCLVDIDSCGHCEPGLLAAVTLEDYARLLVLQVESQNLLSALKRRDEDHADRASECYVVGMKNLFGVL